MSLARADAPTSTATAWMLGLPCDLGLAQRGSADFDRWWPAFEHPPAEPGPSVETAGLLPAPPRLADESALRPPYYLHEILAYSKRVRARCAAALNAGRRPLCIGGDHSISIGPIRAAADFAHAAGRPLSILWLDSHADMNTSHTSPSGMVHGKALAAVLGLEPLLDDGPTPPTLAAGAARVAIVGTQSIDPLERANLRHPGIRETSLNEIRRVGWAETLAQTLDHLEPHRRLVYLSCDLDVIDPAQAGGVNTPCESGLTLTEVLEATRALLATGSVVGGDVVEFNPHTDTAGRTLACLRQIASALGST